MQVLTEEQREFTEYWIRLVDPIVGKFRQYPIDHEDLEAVLFEELSLQTPKIMQVKGPLDRTHNSSQRNYVFQTLMRRAERFRQSSMAPYDMGPRATRFLAIVRAYRNKYLDDNGVEPTDREVADALRDVAARMEVSLDHVFQADMVVDSADEWVIESVADRDNFGLTELGVRQTLEAADTPEARVLLRVAFGDEKLSEAQAAEGLTGKYRTLLIEDARRHVDTHVFHHGTMKNRAHLFRPKVDRKIVRLDYQRQPRTQVKLALKYGVHRTTISRALVAKPKGKPGRPAHPATDLVRRLREDNPLWGPSLICRWIAYHHPDMQISRSVVEHILYGRSHPK